MSDPHQLRLLVVCTANQCRSPMGAALIGRELAERGIRASVTSAGFLPGGQPATRPTVRVMARRGLDVSGHRSRQLDRGMLEAADLVLAMEGGQVVDVHGTWPELTTPVLTLAGAVAYAAEEPPEELDGPSLEQWARSADRPLHQLLDRDEDVVDPVGGPPWAVRRTADRLERLAAELVAAWCDTGAH